VFVIAFRLLTETAREIEIGAVLVLAPVISPPLEDKLECDYPGVRIDCSTECPVNGAKADAN